MNNNRIEKIKETLQESELDAIALVPGASMVHASGLHFHLMERPVVLLVNQQGPPAIILPEMELQKLADLPFNIHSFSYGENPKEWSRSFRDAFSATGLVGKTIGMDPLSIRMMEYEYLRSASNEINILNARDLIAMLRLKKDEQEITAMKKAVKVAQEAMEKTIPNIHAGVSEKKIASELTMNLFMSGSDPDLPFTPIVSTGRNGANPHAVPSDHKLEIGDLLVIDWGARVDGYISDITRTFAIGEVQPEFINIHKIVLEANAAGRLAGKPGEPCASVDIAARNIIEQAGYGEYFTHRTGHGIGMEPHEDPYMRADNEQILEPGMAYTVEPGIYLSGRNGVRIEDDVVVTQTGSESLSDMDRQLIIID